MEKVFREENARLPRFWETESREWPKWRYRNGRRWSERDGL